MRLIAVAAACTFGFGIDAAVTRAISNLPDTSSPSIVVDGQVDAIVSTGSTIVLGGAFTHAGTYTGSFVSAPVGGGAPVSLPATNGTVDAVAADGSGGWYIGGSFTEVGTSAISNLAHITSGGSVDTGWNPAPNAQVSALALSSGGTLYVGGSFTSIDGATRNDVAALTASSAALSGWNPGADGAVTVLKLSPDGNTVYAAGSFATIDGDARAGLAALSASTGVATSWNPAPNATNTVSALAVSPDGTTVYAGGSFTSIGGSSISYLAALSASTGSATSWAPAATGPVDAVAISSDGATVYVGGSFATIGGQARTDLAAVSASTGDATSWDPSPNNTVTAVALSGSTLYAGGTFTTIGGQSRQDVAALSTSDGTATTWEEDANGQVSALAITSSYVGFGGSFSGAGLSARTGLAAVTTSGSLLAFDPGVSGGAVDALALSPDDSTVYVGGAFTSAGGQSRAGLAAVSLSTGLVGSWNPGVSGGKAAVYALATAKDSGGNTVVFVGGNFTKIAGTVQTDIGEVDAAGAHVSWAPAITAGTGSVNALALATNGSGEATAVYVGGGFSQIGGQSYKYVAALDPSTAAAVTWSSDPTITATVSATAVPVGALALSSDGTTLYIGGDFTKINTAGSGVHIAALSTTTGALSSWNPNASSNVNALVLSSDGSTIYAGGSFATIGTGSPTRNGAAGLSTSSGSATTWNPDVTGGTNVVEALAITSGGIVAGGDWTSIGSASLAYYAAFGFDVPAATTNPSVGGTTTVGSTLTCSSGVWSNAPSSYAYQWLRDGSDISGATSSTYLVTSSDLGHADSCKVTATNSEGSGKATSSSVAIVSTPVNTSSPIVQGTDSVGSLLTCNSGTWTYSPTFAYAWLRNGAAISGATSVTYTAASADGGQAVACRVTGTNDAGSSTATSAAVEIPALSTSRSTTTTTTSTTTTAPTPAVVTVPTTAAATANVTPGSSSSLTLASSASVSWSAGTFTADGVLSVAPMTLTGDIDGFSKTSRVVSVSFGTGGAAASAIAFLPNPLTIAFTPPTLKAAIPSYSEDGTSWTPLAPLSSAELGAGKLDGFYQDANGDFVVYTRHTGYFALLDDIQPPTHPATVVASLAKNVLHLGWSPSADNSRRIRAYEILRGKQVVRTISGSHATGTVNLAALTQTGVYSVRAVDYAGNIGPASRSIRVVVKPRPKGVPARIPAWAQKLAAWQSKPAKSRGLRPTTPAHVPAWYAKWRRWAATRLSLKP